LFADSIKASSLNRLHQQAGQKTAPDQCHCVNLSLATREPSTEDTKAIKLRDRTGPEGDIPGRSEEPGLGAKLGIEA
jgi:hypothetical protein